MTTTDRLDALANPRIAILISGRGSNMEAILERRAELRGEIVLVVSSRADAAGLERAAAFGVPTHVISGKEFLIRADYDAAMDALLREHSIDFVVLAGFMRILTDEFVAKWKGRLINIHPSILPSFTGLHAQRQALEAGVRVAGCTVHFVEPGEVDGGAIIAQAVVPVFPDDTEDSLAARIQREEHRLYPESVKALLSGALRLEGGKVMARSREDVIPITAM